MVHAGPIKPARLRMFRQAPGRNPADLQHRPHATPGDWRFVTSTLESSGRTRASRVRIPASCNAD
jgi:hypothetical protein